MTMLRGSVAGLLTVWVCCCAESLQSAPEESGDELKLVHVIFRHGERTPADTYPKDPYVNFTFEPVGWGQLINEGKVNQYRQGQFLRERYNALLGDLYSPDYVTVQSTGVPRALMSAQLEAAGLWPPVGSQVWNPELLWQPVPVISQPLEQDTLLLVRTSCPRYHQERQNVLNSSQVQQILTENKAEELYKFLQEQTGLEYKDPDDVQSLYSTLKAEEDFNLSLPEWTRGVYPDQLVPLTVFSYMLNAYNTQLQKLKAGPLLKKIIGDTDAKISGESRKTMYMYSGHDSTISNILLALGVWEPQLPVYNIMVLIELHRTLDSGYGVKVFLRNTTAVPPHLLTIPGCEQLCPYDKFLQLTSQVVPTDLDTACKVDNPDFVVPIAATP